MSLILKRTLWIPLLFLSSFLRANNPIIQLSIEGVINPAYGDYVKGGIKRAEEVHASALLIELNTPGGLLDATRTMIGAMINTEIPVIVYVSPRGARATSAGVFITMAADIAAMAPETHIGAAHPVRLGGGPLPPRGGNKKNPTSSQKSVMEEKMVSDASAYIRALAKERGRNADWAERAVRESVSLTDREAKEKNVIDLVAESRSKLLERLDGQPIKKKGQKQILKLKDAPIESLELTSLQKFLHLLAHPNVAYLLMMIGIYGLIYEFYSPGVGLGGAVGVICLAMALYSMQVLPINIVGAALIILGILLLIIDLLTPTYGLLTMGGLLSFGAGAFMLIDPHGDLPSYSRVSLSLILPTVVTMGLLFGWALRKTIIARRAKPKTGPETLVGSEGEVREKLNPKGLVLLQGELWSSTADQPIGKGEKVIVLDHQGNTLRVKKLESKKRRKNG